MSEEAPPLEVGAPSEGAAPPPRGEARRRRGRRRRVLAAIVVAVVLAGAVAWYELEANPLGGPGPAVLVQVRPGQSTGSVVAELTGHKVIGSSLAFRVSELFHGVPTVEPGAYLFHQNLSFGAVRARLAAGPNVSTLEVSAGLTLEEVAQRVTDLLPTTPRGSFLAAAKGAVHSPYSMPGSGSLEGTIATGRYLVLPGETATHLLGQMVARFDQQAARLHLAAAAAGLGVTPAQLVVVASIVEKEGVYQKNMGKVARVIYNRLETGTPLQMDSTVLYSLGQDGGPVTSADLALDTPYNTYLHTGLPPTAICTPSLAALEAAAHPTPGPWRYFTLVSKDGTEQFSVTYAQQLAAEALAASRGVP